MKDSYVSFLCGQPLGSYSSWPLFALAHHVLVWLAAELVYPGIKFLRYAILGAYKEISSHRESKSRSYVSIFSGRTGSFSFFSKVSHFPKRIGRVCQALYGQPIEIGFLTHLNCFSHFFHPFGLLGIREKEKENL